MSKIQEIREISHAKMESHARNVGKNGRIEMANAQPKDKHAGNAISQTILQPNAVLKARLHYAIYIKQEILLYLLQV